MYHKIDGPGSPGPAGGDEKRYCVSLESFSAQMAALKAAGRRGSSLGEVLAAAAGGRGADLAERVVITFDDGNRSDRACALPILAANGFTATFFVTGDRVGRPDGIGEDDIRELSANGMEIGAHGMSHRFLSGLSAAEQEVECRESGALLSRITGEPVRYFALPGGRGSEGVLRVLRALSYEAVCTSVFGYNRSGGDPFRLRRIPVMRSTSEPRFMGYVLRSPAVVYPALAAERSRALARRMIGERAYLGLRSRFVRR